MTNIKKFLSIGVMSILSATSSFANNIDIKSTVGTTAQEAAYILKLAQDIDISKIAPNVNIDYIVMQKKHVRSGGATGEAIVNITSQTCKIYMPIGTDFSSSYLGTNEHHDFMKSVVTPENRNQELLRTEFAILHEAAHCNLYGTDKPFRADNQEVEELLNKYFRLSGTSFLGEKGEDKYESLYSILHENYADALAAMELIRKHGNTPDVLSILSKSATERHETASARSKNEFDSHGANYTLDEVIKPEMITQIMTAPTTKDVQELALKVANKGAFKVINTYGEAEKIIGPDSLNSGVASLTIRQIYGKILQKKDHANINMYHNTNELFKIATATTAKLFINFKEDFSKMKTEKDVKNWVNFHASDVLTEANNQVIGNLKNNKYENKNIYMSIIDYIKSTPKGDKLTIAQIKQKGSYDLVKFSSKEVPSVMTNIENIRNQSQTQTSAIAPKIKIK